MLASEKKFKAEIEAKKKLEESEQSTSRQTMFCSRAGAQQETGTNESTSQGAKRKSDIASPGVSKAADKRQRTSDASIRKHKVEPDTSQDFAVPSRRITDVSHLEISHFI